MRLMGDVILLDLNCLCYNFSNEMSQNAAQLHHKMCKKVAQLTRVIFYLNTKNDEYESNLRAVVNAYEQQLDNTLKEANIIISKYKDAADQANKNADLEMQIKKVQENVEKEKEKSYQEFQRYKRSCEERQAKLNSEADRKLREYKNQVQETRGRVEALSRTFDALTNKLQNQRKAHEKAINDLNRQHGDKYSSLNKKKIEIEQELNVKKGKITDLQKLISDLKRQLQEQIRKQKLSSQALLQDLKKQSERKIRELEEKLMKAEKRANTAQTLIDSLKAQLADAQSEVSALNSKVAKYADIISQKDINIQNLKNDLTIRSKECGDLKESNRILQRTNEQLENTIKELEDRLNHLTRQSSLKNGQFDSMRQLYERQLAQKNTQISVIKDKLAQANKKIELLGLQLAGLKDANDKNSSEKLREIEKLKQKIEELNNMIDSLKSNSSDQLKDLQRLLREKTAKFEQEMKDMIAQYQNQIKELAARHQNEIRTLKGEHAKDKEVITAKHHEEIQAMRRQYEAKLKQLEQKLAEEIKKMQDSSGYLKKMYEEKIINYEKEIKSLKQQIEENKQIIASQNNKISKFEEELQLARRQKLKLKEDIEKLEEEMAAMKRDRNALQGDLGEQIERLKKQLREQQYSYEEQIRLMKTDHQKAIQLQQKLLNERFEQDKKRMKDRFETQFEEMQSKYKAKIQDLEDQIKRMSGRSQLSNSQWLEKLRLKEEEYQKLLEQRNRKHIQELKQLENKYEKKIEDLKKKHKEELQNQQKHLTTQKNKALSELEEKLNKQKKAVINDYEEQLKKLSQKFDKDHADMKADYERQLREAAERLQNEKRQHGVTRGKYEQLQSSFEILGRDLDIERNCHNVTKQKLGDRQDNITQLSSKIDKLIKAHGEELNRLKTEYNYREEELKRQHDKKIQAMVAEQIDWTQEMKKEFGSMIEQNKQRIRLMREQYDELKQLFDERPSKDEDLRLIQRLQQALEQREEDLKRAWQQLKFFKLELINRENNYNKMFNANPNIGILDPFEAKTKVQKESGGLPSVTKKSIK